MTSFVCIRVYCHDICSQLASKSSISLGPERYLKLIKSNQAFDSALLTKMSQIEKGSAGIFDPVSALF